MVVSIERPRALQVPAIWRRAPQEGDQEFLRVFRTISVAVQTCLRERIPPLFLANPKIFEHPSLVYPMLMYAASRPLRAMAHGELTYDPIDPHWFAKFVASSRRRLSPRLREVYDRLDRKQAGALSKPYGPRRAAKAIKAVQRYAQSRKLLTALVAGEGALMRDLVRLGGLRQLPRKKRELAIARFSANFERHLRRMGPGCNLSALAPVVLDAATRALAQAQTPAQAA